jgi:hypothetical protein
MVTKSQDVYKKKNKVLSTKVKGQKGQKYFYEGKTRSAFLIANTGCIFNCYHVSSVIKLDYKVISYSMKISG